MKNNKTIQTKKQGYILVFTLVILSIMMVMVYYSSSVLFAETAIARNQKAATIALNLAEAGVQDAVWQIKNDGSIGGAKDKFLNSVSGETSFSKNPALLSGGSYSGKIVNSAKGVATITSTGLYQFGSRTAQRTVIQNVAQATGVPLPYAAAFSSAGGSATGDLEFSSANLTIIGGGLMSGRDLSITQNSNIVIEKEIKYVRNLTNKDSTVSCNGGPGCTMTPISDAPDLPEIDFDSSSVNSYKNQAIAQNKYFSSQSAFFNFYSFSPNTSKTLDGVVYIDGKLDIDQGRTLTMNGVLVSNDTINVGSTNNGSINGTLIMQNPVSKISGVLVGQKLIINKRGSFSGTGLIWAGNAVDFNDNTSSPINITGAILNRRLYINNRTVTITYNESVITSTLADPTASPVIDFGHWEEEYN